MEDTQLKTMLLTWSAVLLSKASAQLQSGQAAGWQSTAGRMAAATDDGIMMSAAGSRAAAFPADPAAVAPPSTRETAAGLTPTCSTLVPSAL